MFVWNGCSKQEILLCLSFFKTIILFNCDIRACYGFVSIAGHACVVCSLQTENLITVLKYSPPINIMCR